jgi:hypothetical protein
MGIRLPACLRPGGDTCIMSRRGVPDKQKAAPVRARPRNVSRWDAGSGDSGDLAGLQALRADSHAPGLAIDQDLCSL